MHSIAWGDSGICMRQYGFNMPADNLTLGLSKCRRVEQTVSLNYGATMADIRLVKQSARLA